jgi:hypothetical protein
MAIKKFQDLQVEHPQRYEVTDNAGTENLKTIKFSPGKVYQEGTKETAVIFNNIQKNGLYTVIGTRVIEGAEEIYDVELEGLEEFGMFDINLQLISNAKNTTSSPKLRILNEKYSFINNLGTIRIGDLTTNNIYIVKIDTIKKTAFLMESNKLDKGTYSGNAGDLKAEIDGKVSKSGDTMTGVLTISAPKYPEIIFNDPDLAAVGYNVNGKSAYLRAAKSTGLNIYENNTATLQANNLNTKNKEVVAAINEIEEKFKNFCPFPVNSLFLTLGIENPHTLFLGTTWEKQEGRFLLGSSSTYAIGSTGGNSTIILTEANMPRHRHQVDTVSATIPEHTHTINTGTNDYRRNDGRITWGGTVDFRSSYTTNSAGGGYTGAMAPYTNYVGSGTAFNNMPPYLVVNIWKRLT